MLLNIPKVGSFTCAFVCGQAKKLPVVSGWTWRMRNIQISPRHYSVKNMAGSQPR